MTRRELKQMLARDGRKWVREVWKAASGAAADLDALSPLTTVLGNRLVEDYAVANHLGGGEIQRALRIVIVAGYGTRIVLVTPTEQPTLRPAAFHLGRRADAERIAGDAAAVNRLLDDVRAIATDRWDSVMSLPREVWTGYEATAAMKLQRQLTTQTLTWRELTRERIETMLRYGYVLCCLDEAIDAEPVVRDLRSHGTERPAAAEPAAAAGPAAAHREGNPAPTTE